MFKKFKTAIDNLKGDIAEVGVYQGSTALQLAQTFPDKTIHLFDTFCGMPQSDPSIDGHKEGDFANTSLERVKEKLKGYENIIYHPGIFPEAAAILSYRQFAFVNVDADLYVSTANSLLYFWPRIVAGGVIHIQDDYGAPRCLGATKAVDEFVRVNSLQLKKEGAAVWIVK